MTKRKQNNIYLVDFDRTLSQYQPGDLSEHGDTHCGPPVPLMLERVKKWLAEGKDVRIFTARVSLGDNVEIGSDEWNRRVKFVADNHTAIREWCLQHIGVALPVTAEKNWMAVELWDDRAKQVYPNTGTTVEEALFEAIKKCSEQGEYIEALEERIAQLLPPGSQED